MELMRNIRNDVRLSLFVIVFGLINSVEMNAMQQKYDPDASTSRYSFQDQPTLSIMILSTMPGMPSKTLYVPYNDKANTCNSNDIKSAVCTSYGISFDTFKLFSEKEIVLDNVDFSEREIQEGRRFYIRMKK
jgi:hypothetical protein